MRQNKLLFTLFMLLWSGLASRAQTIIFSENFNSTSSGNTPPTGWVNNMISGNSSYDFWRFGQSGVTHSVGNPGSFSGPRTASAPISGTFALFDADATSSGGGTENVALESPTINTTGQSVVWLKFDHYYENAWAVGAAGFVEVYDGTSWVQVASYSANSSGTQNINISTYAANKTNVKVRFRFFDNYGYWWIVDNVELYVPPAFTPPAPVNLFLINEPFTTASGSTPPTGWSNNVISGLSSEIWKFNNPGSISTAAPISSPFANFNSDAYGNNGTAENVALESPTVSSRGYSVVRLKWDQKFDVAWGGKAYVELFNGTSWVAVYSNTTTSHTGTLDIDVSSQIANKAGIKVRFRWEGNYSMYWIVDNVQLYVPGPIYFVNEPFTGATGTTHPAGWSNNVITGVAGDSWRYNNPAARSQQVSPITSPFAIFDSDNTSGGITGPENVALETPALNTTGQSTVKLKWDQYYRGGYQSGDSIVTEVFDGTAWNKIYYNNAFSSSGAAAFQNTQSLDISSLAANKTTGKVRFRFVGNYSWWWIVDNVQAYVPVQPTADFTINNATQCVTGNSFVFTNNSTIPYGTTMSYSWNFGDVTTSTAQDPTKSYASPGTYTVTLTVTSSTGETAVISKQVTVTGTVTPSVAIAVSPGNSFCPGTNATFTATPTNGGAAPVYQWKKNGSNVGTNSAVYSDNTLTTGDVITVVMTSNACVTPATAQATSNGITINTSFPASVTIAANTITNVCAGTVVTFTATPVNAGTPAYQWKVNGGNVGTNQNTYTVAPGNGDVVTVQMTSSIACASPKPATSNAITMTHATPAVPSVTITKNPSTAICPGTAVTFLATPTNGGPAPSYQWKLNGVNVGTNSAGYASSSLNNNDVVSVIMTSSICASPTTGTANTTITVNANTATSVSIAANPGNTICSGTGVVFTATPTGGGASPSYQWKKNAVNVGTNSVTYNAGTTLVNGDQITCVMTSNATCALPKTPTSNAINMNVTNTVSAGVSIATVPSTTACSGAVLQFVANPVNGGNTPSYVWKLDNVVVPGATGPAFTNNGTLSVGNHTINVVMTSSVTQCISSTTASTTITKTISPLVTPTIVIASTQAPGGDACTGASVTFTPTTTNAGTTPTYNWKKNGVSVSTAASYPAGTSLATGDVITCEMASAAACASPVNVTSAPVNITVWPNITATATITANPGASVSCTGLPVTFTANTTNMGSNPTFQWKKNGVNVGTNSANYTDAGLVTGNTISCQITTSIPCATPKPLTSNTLTMTMNPIVTGSINLTVTPDSVGCDKTPFTFHTFHTNGGSNPAFQWYKNGVAIPGAAQSVYSNNNLADGDAIACELISNAVCVFPVMSTPMTVGITPSPVPTLKIAGVPDDQGIHFVAYLNDAGNNPTFQWRKNGHDIQGATGQTYKGVGLQPNDKINVFVHADIECANPEFLLSNTLDVGKVTSISTVTSSFDELTLFPNPNEGRFTVKGSAKASANSKASIEVLNAVGQLVFKNTTDLKGTELEVEVDLGGHNAAGMYMLRVTVDGHTDNLRFIMKD